MASRVSKDKRLEQRTCKLIEEGKQIILKSGDGWYLHCWTNIAAGPDQVQWGKRPAAMEIFNLKWAFAIAPLYKCEVYSYHPGTGVETLEKR